MGDRAREMHGRPSRTPVFEATQRPWACGGWAYAFKKSQHKVEL